MAAKEEELKSLRSQSTQRDLLHQSLRVHQGMAAGCSRRSLLSTDKTLDLSLRRVLFVK